MGFVGGVAPLDLFFEGWESGFEGFLGAGGEGGGGRWGWGGGEGWPVETLEIACGARDDGVTGFGGLGLGRVGGRLVVVSPQRVVAGFEVLVEFFLGNSTVASVFDPAPLRHGNFRRV